MTRSPLGKPIRGNSPKPKPDLCTREGSARLPRTESELWAGCLGARTASVRKGTPRRLLAAFLTGIPTGFLFIKSVDMRSISQCRQTALLVWHRAALCGTTQAVPPAKGGSWAGGPDPGNGSGTQAPAGGCTPFQVLGQGMEKQHAGLHPEDLFSMSGNDECYVHAHTFHCPVTFSRFKPLRLHCQ